MRPGMILNLVPFAGGSGHNFRMLRRVLADDEESGLDLVRGQEVSDTGGW